MFGIEFCWCKFLVAFAIVWILITAVLAAVSHSRVQTMNSKVDKDMSKQDENHALDGASSFFAISVIPVTLVCVSVASMITRRDKTPTE